VRRTLRAFWRRVGDPFVRSRRERELASEIDAHLALHIADNVRAGMTPADARRDALVALGGVEPMKEAYRDRRGLPFVETLGHDLKFGWRMLVKEPGFALVAIAALTVGIGANVAIFTLANALLLRPLPAVNPDRVVRVATFNFSSTPYDEYVEYRDVNRTLEHLAAFNGVSLSLRLDDTPEHLFGMAVTGNYFELLGATVARGRPILRSDDERGAPGAVVLGDRFWHRRFGADPKILGRTVTLNGQPYAVVGVGHPRFAGTMAPFVPDVFVAWNGPGMEPPGGAEGSAFFSRTAHLIGRLRPDATIFQTQADLGAVAAGIARRHPDTRANLRVTVYPGRTLAAEFSDAVTVFVSLLAGIVGLVLLIACVNIANLLLARSAARRREIGVRLAMGAGRRRLVRQLLTESAMLAAIGATCGVLLAVGLTRLVAAIDLPLPIPIELNLSFDWRIAVFAVAVTGLTTILFGLVPAWQAAKVALVGSLKDGTPGAGAARSRLRSVLITAQVALSTVLLITGAVLARGMTAAHAIDRGFVSTNVLTASLDLHAGGYTTDRGRALLDTLIDRLEGTAGITAANAAFIVPLTLSNNQTRFYREGEDPRADTRPLVYFNQVTRGHFRTMGIPLIAGRDFTRADGPGAPDVGIVNETLAADFWPGENPVGRRLRMRTSPGEAIRWIEIVGVARNSKYVRIGEDPASFLYRPLAQDYQAGVTLLVRTTGEPMAVLPVVRSVVRSIDAELPVFNASPLDAVTAVSLVPVQVAAMVSGVLGLVGLLLAAVGLYGVMSFIVRQRTKEIGTRIALGATPGEVIRVMTWQGMRWTLVGLAFGLGVAWLGTRLLTNLLYGVEATDPVAFIGIVGLLSATALLACVLPARRASRIDPLVALRQD